MGRIATPEDLKRWDADALAGAPAFESPTVPEALSTSVISEAESVHVNRTQDVEPILDRCKSIAAEGDSWSPSRELKLKAEFPMVLVERYCVGKGVTFQEFLANPEHVKNMLADLALSDFNIEKNTIHRTYR